MLAVPTTVRITITNKPNPPPAHNRKNIFASLRIVLFFYKNLYGQFMLSSKNLQVFKPTG